jgi:DNA-binding beta-propeller fold protein YncE
MKAKGLIPIFTVSLLLFLLVAGRGRTGDTFVTPPWNHCLGMNRVSQFHLDIFSGYRETFNDPQGMFCIKLVAEDDPESEKDDDELTVFGLNRGEHDLIYNKGLTSIAIVGGYGTEPGRFSYPTDVTGDSKGNIYITDTGNGRLVHMQYVDGELVWTGAISMPDGDTLINPYGVVLSGGRLYTTDTGNDRIVFFGTDGKLLDVFNPSIDECSLFRPTGVAAVSAGDDWLYYSDYFIAVIDSMGQRLWKVSPNGKAIALKRYAETGGRGSFEHVAIDYYGSIYVTDSRADKIHKFDRHLNYIVSIGGGERGEDFDEPRGITIYRRFGQIFISEKAGAQYFWVGTDIYRLSVDNLTFDIGMKECSIDLSFLLTEHSDLTLYLEDENGKQRFTIVDGYTLPLGYFDKQLRTKCDQAEALAKCKFRLVAIAKPTYSSNAFLSVRKESRLVEPTIKQSTASASR